MIGIITFHCQYNYGSALQAYALQETIKNLGYSCEIINYYYKKDMKNYDIRWSTKNVKVILFDLVTFTKCFKRKKSYKQFHNIFFKLSNYTDNYNNLNEICKKYDILISGSDQIWNFSITEGINPAYFLKFASNSQKLISYAPSIAMSNIPKNLEKKLKHELERYSFVSVREKATADQLSRIINKKVFCVLDPTLLLDKHYYNKHLLKSYHLNLPKDYIYIYCLHHNHLGVLEKFAENYANKHKLKIVYFNKYNIKKRDYELNTFEYDPRAFVYTIKHAKCVVSDSFHAGLFLIIYHKEFYTYALEDSKSRMDTVFDALNIKDRFINENSIKFNKIDYNEVDKLLKEKIKESLEYLKGAIDNI